MVAPTEVFASIQKFRMQQMQVSVTRPQQSHIHFLAAALCLASAQLAQQRLQDCMCSADRIHIPRFFAGLPVAVELMKDIADKYEGVSYADLFQMASAQAIEVESPFSISTFLLPCQKDFMLYQGCCHPATQQISCC